MLKLSKKRGEMPKRRFETKHDRITPKHIERHVLEIKLGLRTNEARVSFIVEPLKI